MLKWIKKFPATALTFVALTVQNIFSYNGLITEGLVSGLAIILLGYCFIESYTNAKKRNKTQIFRKKVVVTGNKLHQDMRKSKSNFEWNIW